MSDLSPIPGALGEPSRGVESLLRETQRIAQIGSWEVDPGTETLVWTDEMFRIYGLPRSESHPTPADCLASVHPDDRPLTQEAYASAMRDRTALDFIHRVTTADGSVKHVRVRGEFTCAADGTLLRSTGTAQDVTVNVLRERSLADRERVLKSVFTAMSEGVVMQGRSGEIIDANPAALAILGLSHDELMGRTSVDPRWQSVREDGTALPGSEHPGMVTLRSGQALREQVMGIHDPHRGLRWISVNSDPVYGDGEASPVGVVATFVDITEKRKTEVRLAVAAAEVEDLYEHAPCGYHSIDASGTFIRVNATELDWLGCSLDEVVGKKAPTDFFTAEGKEQFRRTFPRLKTEGRVADLEFDLVPKSGPSRRVSVTATAAFDADGRFQMSRSVVYDITELHLARAALQAAVREQAAMMNSDIVGMLRVRKGIIVWTTLGMDKIFGYERGDWDEMPISTLFDDDACYRATAARIGALAPGVGMFREDQKLLRKDGSSVWVDVSTVKIDPSGLESFTIVKDISDRKKVEAERLRSVELESQNLALLEAGRLKDAFLANMSHELRTPLNAVTGFAHLLQSKGVGAETPKHAQYIRQIGESARHLLELVQTMLDFAKAASNEMVFSPEVVSVQTTLEEVAAMLEPKRLAASVVLELSVAGDLGSIVSDPLRLRQMVLNLAGNAVKFSRAGGTVWLRARGWNEQQWCVEVEDRGIGISAEDINRLFATFVQLSAGSTKDYGGTGLGLALVRKIARAQGGDVQVRSQLGVGSVFTLVLPRALAQGLPTFR